MSTHNVTTRVVGNDMCSGCGVCAGVCPSTALTMRWSALGELQPVLEGTCPPGCGLCLEICPFSGEGADPGQVALASFGGREGFSHRDETGFYRTCRVGFSERDGQRTRGSSGGMATWLMTGLLEAHLVDDVLCVVPVVDDPEGRLFRSALLVDVAAVEQAAGSRYYPVEVSAALRQLLRAGGDRRCVAVGLPCVVHAVNLARARLPRLARRIPYTVALACGRLPGRSYTEYLARCSGLPVHAVRAAEYRLKERASDAGDFGFVATGDDGARGRLLPFSGEPGAAWKTWSFMHRACLFCDDLFGETADAVFMDAWLDGYVEDLRGHSLVLSRSGVIDGLLDEGLRRGTCRLQAIAVERVIASQKGGLFHKRVLIRGFLERAARRGEWAPPRRCDPSAAVYRRHRLRIDCVAGTLAASKAAWQRCREDASLAAFRAAVRPWERRARMLDAAEALKARVRRLLRDPGGVLKRRLFPERD